MIGSHYRDYQVLDMDEALKNILDSSLEMQFFTVRYDKRDLELIKMAKEHGISIELSKNINPSDVAHQRI